MPTDLVSTLGASATAYSVAAGTALLLQARTMKRRGSSRDVSLAFLSSTTGGYLIWLLYGWGIGSFPLVIADAIGLASSLVAVVVALRLRRPGASNQPQRHEPEDEPIREFMQLRVAAAGPSASSRARHDLRRRLLEAEQPCA